MTVPRMGSDLTEKVESTRPTKRKPRRGRECGRGVTITLSRRDARRLGAARVRILAALAGTDAAGRALDHAITADAFAAYLVGRALDRIEVSED